MKQDQYQKISGIQNSYRVKGVLGHGAISEVLIGSIINEEDPYNEQYVAIKVLKNTTFIGNQENKYFFQEKDIVNKLSSQRDDHIVNIIEVIETNGQYHIIMEYCENGCLLDQICHEIPNRLKVVVNFSTQLTRGVHFLHNHGIAHRDLKPENIFIHEKDGQYILKIGDYGLGKNEEIYMMHSCIGTINYMAPEMIRKEEYDFTVDIWALGCIMHELITGEQLFADYTISEISSQIKSMEEYKCIEGRFGDLISRCLQPKAQNRIKIQDLYSGLYCLYDDIASQRVEIAHKVIYNNYRQQQQQQMQQQILYNQQNVCQIYANQEECFNTNDTQNFGMDNLNEQLSIYIQKDNLSLVGQILTPRSNIPNTPSAYSNFLHPNNYQNSFFKEEYINSINQNKILNNEHNSQNNNSSNKTGEENITCSGEQIFQIDDQNFQNQQQQEQSVIQSECSLDSRYLDLNQTQNYNFYQDKDTQQALRKKAQINKKKGKTHKIKKNKEIMNSLNLKHANSEIYLAQESPSSYQTINQSSENRFNTILPQDFTNSNIIIPSPQNQSNIAQNPQQYQQQFENQTTQIQNSYPEQLQPLFKVPQPLQKQYQQLQQQQQQQHQNNQTVYKQQKFQQPQLNQQFQPSQFQNYQQIQKLEEQQEDQQIQSIQMDQSQISQYQLEQGQQFKQSLNQPQQNQQFDQTQIQQLQQTQPYQQPQQFQEQQQFQQLQQQHFQQNQLIQQAEIQQQNKQFLEESKFNTSNYQQMQQQQILTQNNQQIQRQQQQALQQQLQQNEQINQFKQFKQQQNQQMKYHIVVKEPQQVQYQQQNNDYQFIEESQQDIENNKIQHNQQFQHQQIYEQPQKVLQQNRNEQIYHHLQQQQFNLKHQNIQDLTYNPQNQQYQHLKQQYFVNNNNNKQQYYNHNQQNYLERQYQNIPQNYNHQQIQQIQPQQLFIPQYDFQYNNQRCNDTYMGYTDSY